MKNKFKIVGRIIDTKSRIIVLIILGVIIAIVGKTFDLSRVHLLLVVFLLYGTIIFYAYMLLNIETRKAVKELEEECDPEKFLSRINNMVTYVKTPKSIRNWILVNKSAGLIETGCYDDTINLLEQINEHEMRGIYIGLYYNNLASCYIEKFLFQKAENTLITSAENNLNKLLEMINGGKVNGKYLEIFHDSYNSNKIYLDICKGEYEKSIKQLEECYSKAKQLRQKVTYRFGIGYCYYMSNNKIQSKEHFKYVIANGNKLYHVQQSQKYIEGIM